jgi:hypothetical protein
LRKKTYHELAINPLGSVPVSQLSRKDLVQTKSTKTKTNREAHALQKRKR